MTQWIKNLFSSSPAVSMMRLLCLVVGGVATFELIYHFKTLTDTQADLLKAVFGFVFGFKFAQSASENVVPYLTDKFKDKGGNPDGQ